MLIYLDTAQFAWLEQAEPADWADFRAEWRELGCQLALSLQLLQETAKRGTQEDVRARIETMKSLRPLRGIPAGSAGVMVREVTLQMSELLGKRLDDPIGYGTAALFPMMDDSQLEATLRDHGGALERFNLMGNAQAELEVTGKAIPPVRKNVIVNPDDMNQMMRSALRGLPEGSDSFLNAIREGMIKDLRAADGDTLQAFVNRFGLSGLKCLPGIRTEDLSKAAGFLEAARFAIDDIASELGVEEETAMSLVNDLRPYEAPGYSLEMAVSRARMRHNAAPKASDQVDEEHVCFAPYVDLLFVDKRTRAFIEAECRREDGRVVPQAAASITVAGDLEDVRRQLRDCAAGRAHQRQGPGS